MTKTMRLTTNRTKVEGNSNHGKHSRARIWIGVDIGGTKTAVVLSTNPPKILSRAEFPTLPEQGAKRILDLIPTAIDKLLEKQLASRSQLQAIGISCGGPLDRVSGVIQSPPNLPTWSDIPITDILRREFKVDCRLENDANAGVIAEHRFGAGQSAKNMIFLTMGTGFGAGILANGQLYRGASDLAGEIGHVRLTDAGPRGYNKAGSVEGWVSGSGMAKAASREVASAVARKQATMLIDQLERHGGALTARDIAVAARKGDRLASQIIQDTGMRLGGALAILVDLLNPELIVIGGLAMRFGERLLIPARASLKDEALLASVKACKIIPAKLGERIGDVAALCVAMGLE